MNTTKTTEAARHTPGPWEAWDDDGTGTLPCVLAKQVTSYGNFYVAQCNVFEDAKLVAAAPDLLAACEKLIWATEIPSPKGRAVRMEYAIQDVAAAIAKARGQ